MFVTLDGGGAWMRENAGFTNMIVEHLAIKNGRPSIRRIAPEAREMRGPARPSALPPLTIGPPRERDDL